jgi:signal transduction histidine kinase
MAAVGTASTSAEGQARGAVGRWARRHPYLALSAYIVSAAIILGVGSGNILGLHLPLWQDLLIAGGFAAVAAAYVTWHTRRPLEFFLAAATYALIWSILLQPRSAQLAWGSWVFVWIALYYVAARATVVTAWVGLVTAQAVHSAMLTWAGIHWRAWLPLSLLINVVFGVAAILLGQRRRTVDDLIGRNQLLLRQRDERAELAVAAERNRIAREMHDIVSHSLTVMVSLSDGAARLTAADPAAAVTAMHQVSKTGRHAVADMRRVLAFLRSEADLAPLPSLSDLGDLVALYQHSGLPVSVELTTDLPEDTALGLNIYRIVQEALTNVLRYAPSTPSVTVRIAQPERGSIDVIVDNAPSASPDVAVTQGAGHGLVGMRQRTAVWDGTLEAGPRPDGGWRVHARLCADPDEEPE